MMSDIKKILVPVDGSVNGCKAVDEALSIAEKCGAELDFVYVASNINKDIPSHIVFDRIWEEATREPDGAQARQERARRQVHSGTGRGGEGGYHHHGQPRSWSPQGGLYRQRQPEGGGGVEDPRHGC